MRNIIILILFISIPFSSIAQRNLIASQTALFLKDIETPDKAERVAYVSNDDTPVQRRLIADILGVSGGAIIGWQLGQELAGNEKVDWFPVGVGLGLIVAAIPVVDGDNLSLSIRAVYGDYKMEQMKKTLMQSSPQINDIDVPYSITDNFPAYIGYEVSFSGFINKWSIGTKVSFRSTGGRFGYRDKTGNIAFEHLLQLIEITEFAKYTIIKTRKINVLLGVNLGAGRVMEMRESKIELSDGHLEKYTNKSTSLNIIVGSELMCNLFLTRNLQIEMFGGYDNHVFSGLNKGLNDFPEKAGSTDWTGVRVGLGVGWVFNKSE